MRPKWITRMDHPECGTVGWWVRIVWHGDRQSRFFADKKNGGTRKALRRAVQWRDFWITASGRPAKRRRLVAPQHAWSGTSVKADGQVVAYVCPRPREYLTRTFSFRKYGIRGAKRLALDWRQRMEVRYYGGRLSR